MADLVDFELTWAERIEAEALQRGKVAGKRKMLLHLLRFRFPSVSDELVARVEAITDEALLDRFGDQLFDAASLSDPDLPPRPAAPQP